MVTATASRTGETRFQVELKVLDPAQRLYEEMSADRRRLFHQNRRILVVDDSESTCKRLTRELSKVYPPAAGNTVEHESDPAAAVERILKAKAAGKPYDAVVLDLYMPKLQGAEVLKRMHSAGAFTAVVVNTASMMDPVVSDIVNQFDTHRTQAEMESWYAGSKADMPRPILFHDKSDTGVRGLVNKLDVAMRIMGDGPGDSSEFLKSFNPMLVEANFTAEVAHKIVEETRNCVAEVGGILRYLEAEVSDPEAPLEGTPWWQAHGGRMREALGGLGGFSFRNTYLETPKETGERLHTIANQLVFLFGPPPDRLAEEGFGAYASDGTFQKKARQWHEAVQKPYKLISGLYSSYVDYVRPEVNVPVFVRELVGAEGSVDAQYANLVVRGDKKQLQGLIRGPIDAAIRRQKESPPSQFNVTISYARDLRSDADAQALGIGAAERRRLIGLGCSRCCKVEVSDDAPAPSNVDDAYGPFMGSLSTEQLGDAAAWRCERPPGGGLRFSLYLNLDSGKQE
jgi:CheY-like chemotaxis protein